MGNTVFSAWETRRPFSGLRQITGPPLPGPLPAASSGMYGGPVACFPLGRARGGAQGEEATSPGGTGLLHDEQEIYTLHSQAGAPECPGPCDACGSPTDVSTLVPDARPVRSSSALRAGPSRPQDGRWELSRSDADAFMSLTGYHSLGVAEPPTKRLAAWESLDCADLRGSGSLGASLLARGLRVAPTSTVGVGVSPESIPGTAVETAPETPWEASRETALETAVDGTTSSLLSELRMGCLRRYTR